MALTDAYSGDFGMAEASAISRFGAIQAAWVGVTQKAKITRSRSAQPLWLLLFGR